MYPSPKSQTVVFIAVIVRLVIPTSHIEFAPFAEAVVREVRLVRPYPITFVFKVISAYPEPIGSVICNNSNLVDVSTSYIQ